MKILKDLYLILTGKRAVDPDRLKASGPRVTAEILQKMFGKRCPICSFDFSGHSYATFATTVLGAEEKSRVIEFFEALKEHRWYHARDFQDWDGQRDNAVAYALRCTTGRIALLVVHSPFELYYNDILINFEILSPESGRDLEAVIEAKEWHPLQP